MSLEEQHKINLNEIYKQVIMSHFARPRNKGLVNDPDMMVHLDNPTCGDTIDVQLKVKDGLVEAVHWAGRGCSISMASASMMSEAVKGKPVAEAKAMIDRFKAMMRGEPGPFKELGELQSLSGVAKYPVRIKCATLAWNAAAMGLDQAQLDGRS